MLDLARAQVWASMLVPGGFAKSKAPEALSRVNHPKAPIMFLRIRFLLIASLLGLTVLTPPASAAMMRHHALSLIGEPQYPADFTSFKYVNPDAPKGGTIRMPALGSFDSLNPFILKGVSAAGVGLIYDQLMDTSLDEPSTSYGLLAEWMTYSEDFSTATFKLRDGARWHDGRPVSVEDVIFSLEAMKKGHPFYGQYYKNVVKAEKTGPREVTFTFNVKNNRELPMIVGELTILPKHQGRQAGTLVDSGTGQGLLGRKSAGEAWQGQFRRNPV